MAAAADLDSDLDFDAPPVKSTPIRLKSPIHNFGELIDILAELGVDLEESLVEIMLRFPLLGEVELRRDSMGLRICGW
jgi:hypothetical protein